MTLYQRGDIVRLRAFRGEILIRRVWSDNGRGIAICTDERYQQFLATGDAPQVVGWPREDVLGLGAQAGDARGGGEG